jgi:MoaA/NifB/PqqE/SkfB family radical SAM enzyme
MQLNRTAGSTEPQLIVLVAGVIYTRIAKVGYGLKSLGWRVVLLYNSMSYTDNHSSCFDEMHHYQSVEEALALARQYNPLVYHVFSVWEYGVALNMIHEGLGPVVLDNYDALAGMLKPDFMNSRYPGLFEMEKYCIEAADALCCRNVELNYTRRVLGYAPKGPTLFFPEYCWGTVDLSQKADARDNQDLHIVYAGNMNVEKRCRDDHYLMQFRNGFFLDFGKDLASAGIHIHLYPGRNNCSDEDFDEVFSEYLEAQEKYPCFHMHNTLPEEKLIEEISAYDFGIEATWLETETIGSEHSLPIRNRYGMSSKLFGYLDAGLGLILSENFWMRRRLFEKYGIVRTAYLDFVKQQMLATRPEFFQGLRQRAIEAREQFLVTRHAPRLAEFYFSVAKARNAKISRISAAAQAVAPVQAQMPDQGAWATTAFDKILRAKEEMAASVLRSAAAAATPPAPVSAVASVPVNAVAEATRPAAVAPDASGPAGCPAAGSYEPSAADLATLQRFNEFRPQIFMIESTLSCNLRCPECAMGGRLITRKHQMIGLEQFKILADKIRPYATFLYPYIWGEPTLNPDLVPILRYASGFTPTNISTNGMTMTETLAEELITSGVTSIIVSIDGYSQDVYAKYRVGGDVNKAFNALVHLQRFNLKYGRPVQLAPQFIVFRHNQHEMAPFLEACRSIGLEPAFKAPYLRDDSQFEYSDYQEFIRSHSATEAEQRDAMRECADARNTFTVLVDGSAVACCYDHDKATVFGNLFEQDVEEIWNSPKYRQYRWDVLTGNAPGFCSQNCLTYYKGSPERHRAGSCTADVSAACAVQP